MISKEGPRVGMISLGCAKNLIDSEVMLGHLRKQGCSLVNDPSEADVIVVNTCGFIGPAREESIQTILDTAELKKDGRLKRLVVAGCMVQRYADELKESLPEVDAFIGLDQLSSVVDVVAEELPVLDGPVGPASFLYDHESPRVRSTFPWTAYVKIAEGCDHTCSFCPIPNFRGTFRSRTPDSVVREAVQLAEQGVLEINLVAQDSSHYGRDLGNLDGLPELLEKLDAVDGLRWIRVHYLYPNTVTQRMIDTMASCEKVVPYVDMPLQHAHPETLKRMRRGGSAESHLRLLDRFRQAMPEAALRTTLIVGFPGESETEFTALEGFVEQARFDHVGVFTYSHEEGTGAFEYADSISDEEKEARRDRLMELQREIVADKLRGMVGRVEDVLVEGSHPETDLLLLGRMATQAADVDNQVLINDGFAEAGSIVAVEISEVAGYDLVGRIVAN